MAYATKIAAIEVIRTNNLPFFGTAYELPPDHDFLTYGERSDYDSPETLKWKRDLEKNLKSEREKAESKKHLTNAIANYSKAIALVSTNPITHLGLAWCLQQNGEKEKALISYRKAISRAWQEDQKIEHLFWDALTVEIAGYMRPLLDPTADKAELEQLDIYAKRLERKNFAVTPLLIPLEPDSDLDACIDRNSKVMFDFDGLGRAARGWVTPKAGWLVYDGNRSGTITSGVQLFGNVTFWMFWKNGYEALAVLDDDHDGKLEGSELEHIAIWRDANNDGVSSSEEVRPVAAYGIAALSTAYELTPDGTPFSRSGVTKIDGRVQPTFDVILNSRDPDNR